MINKYHVSTLNLRLDMNIFKKKVMLICLLVAGSAHSQQLCAVVSGATLLAQDQGNTYLGKITNQFGGDSIFNQFGNFGSQFSSASIWNQFSTFGGEFSNFSPFNKFSSTPPMIVKDRTVIGYLSANKNIARSVSPNLLKALCEDNL